jgi:1-acyl-sn-glycerol-3-phosphate acyltransferase
MPFFIRWRSNIFQAPPFLLSTAFFGCLSLLVSLFDREGDLQFTIARVWARVCIFFSGSSLTVIGEENLRVSGPQVYASNHTSYMDTPVVFSALPNQFRILAKTELWKLPFIGWYLARSGQIPIDTANPRATLSSLSAGVKALRAGMPLFVFPEGARTPTGLTQEFLNGAAYLAIRAQVPVVPVALIGVYDLLPIHTTHFYPTQLKLVAGRPIASTGRSLRQTDEFTQEIREAIDRLILENSGQPNLLAALPIR